MPVRNRRTRDGGMEEVGAGQDERGHVTARIIFIPPGIGQARERLRRTVEGFHLVVEHGHGQVAINLALEFRVRGRPRPCHHDGKALVGLHLGASSV